MSFDETLERITKATGSQLDMQQRVIDEHLDATDRVIASQAAQVVIQGAAKLMAVPTTAGQTT